MFYSSMKYQNLSVAEDILDRNADFFRAPTAPADTCGCPWAAAVPGLLMPWAPHALGVVSSISSCSPGEFPSLEQLIPTDTFWTKPDLGREWREGSGTPLAEPLFPSGFIKLFVNSVCATEPRHTGIAK